MKLVCHMTNDPFIMSFGLQQIVPSQIPNFHKLSLLSLIAAVMSFCYSSIGLGPSVAKIAEGHVETSLTGIPVGKDLSSMDKKWNIFSAPGDIAFAFPFSPVPIEIEDTIKSGAPENKVMKLATLIGLSISTFFYMLCGVLGYAAFGNKAPGNFLTGFRFYDPFWLVDFGNLCIVIHLIGAYQLFAQPVFRLVEDWSSQKWGGSTFVTREYPISLSFCGSYKLSLFRLVWRMGYVIVTTNFAMLFPFFNNFMGLLGAATFWPLTVYFPIVIYIARSKVPKFSRVWISMQMRSAICFLISLLAAAGSIQGLAKSVRSFKLFQSVS